MTDWSSGVTDWPHWPVAVDSLDSRLASLTSHPVLAVQRHWTASDAGRPSLDGITGSSLGLNSGPAIQSWPSSVTHHKVVMADSPLAITDESAITDPSRGVPGASFGVNDEACGIAGASIGATG